MSFDGLVGFVATLAAAGWLLWAVNRLKLAWTAAQTRIHELDQRRVDLARGLMKFGEELIHLKQAEKETSDKLAALRAQGSEKQKEVAAFVPPPPQEIYVSSEYPAARGDKPWIVVLARGGAGEPAAHKQYLVWAGDHAAALNRARHVLSEESGYEIVNAQRYG